MIDTHAHIYQSKFEGDIQEVIQNAKKAGVTRIYMPNVDSSTIDGMLKLENMYPGYCFATIGVHPCSVNEGIEHELLIVQEWLEKRGFAAIGEIGIDLYWDKTFLDQQIYAFNTQCEWAAKYELPVIIHCRESIDLTIDLVAALKEKHDITGIFHCFTGNVEQAKRIIDLGFLLGIGGVATFKNGGLSSVLIQIDIDHIVLETDSPYLSPEPKRGKRNEPAHLSYIAKKVAEVKDVEISEVINRTTTNALKIFKHG